jgi:hypothetical protein
MKNLDPIQDNTAVHIPKKSNNTEYDILETNEEQKHIAAKVIDTINKWIAGSPDYKPLRMTVTAGAGRGNPI